jgi:hypothetical protein
LLTWAGICKEYFIEQLLEFQKQKESLFYAENK